MGRSSYIEPRYKRKTDIHAYHAYVSCGGWRGRVRYKVCKFSQFLNFESSLPNIQENIWRARIDALVMPRLRWNHGGGEPSWLAAIFSRIWLRMPTSSSSTLWLMPIEISMNLHRYVHARHLPSANIKFAYIGFVSRQIFYRWCMTIFPQAFFLNSTHRSFKKGILPEKFPSLEYKVLH